MQELSKFALVVESSTLKKKRANIEDKLCQIEDAIQVFSKNKVYVKEDEYYESVNNSRMNSNYDEVNDNSTNGSHVGIGGMVGMPFNLEHSFNAMNL